jgi:hypothetical protein
LASFLFLYLLSLDDSNTIADQPVLGGSSENTHENNLWESDSETEDSPEAVGTPENNSPPQQNIINTHWMRTRGKAGIYKPKLPYIGLTEELKEDKEPESVREAQVRPEWKEAMDAEYKALMNNKTWTLVPFHGQENIIDSKWIYKTKYKADGTIERRKARLVARGFQQTAGLDYDETFSPVVKASTVRIILFIVVHLNWEVRQLDINNAFLNGNLKETVFMHQPEGYIDKTKPHHICRLTKAIYGLK